MRRLIIFLSLIIVLLQYPLWFSDSSLPDAWKLQTQIKTQHEKNLQLEERNRLLKAEVENLKNGLEVVEEKARTELGLIKQGETFYQVIEAPVKLIAPIEKEIVDEREREENSVSEIELIEEEFLLSPKSVNNE